LTYIDVTPQPPPPPPPPPPQRQASGGYDFVQPFAFVFQDPRWVTKVLIGGLFYLAAFLIVGIFFILGYSAKLCRNVVANEPQPLPEWDDLGGYFAEGIRLFFVGFCYVIPLFGLIGVFIVPLLVAGNIAGPDDLSRQLAGGMASCVWCLFLPISLALSFWMPAALVFAAVEQRFGAAFEFGRIYQFIKANFANCLIAFVVYLIARFAASMGLILFCIGIVLTAFWSMIVSTYAFAYAYRLRK
jgi:hypothetical protein